MVGVAYQLRCGLNRIDVDDKIFLVGNEEKYFLSQHIYKNVLDHLYDDLDFSKIRTTLTDMEMAEFYYGLDLLLEKKYIEPLIQEERSENLFEAVCTEINANFPEWNLEQVLSSIYVMRDSLNNRDIVLCEDFLNPELFEIYQSSMNRKREFAAIQVTSKGFWLGPVFRNQQAFCWGCMIKLILRNKPVEHYFLKNEVDAEKWMLTFDVQDYNTLNVSAKLSEYIQDCGFHESHIQEMSYDGEVTNHRVWKQPHCESCGDENYFKKTSTKPIALDPEIKGAKESNGFRTCSPLETWEKHKYLISTATGILSYIKPFEGKNHPLRPVYVGNYFLPHGYIQFQSGEISANSFGKGTNPQQSRVSALCEGVERSSYRYTGDEVEKISNWNNMGRDAVHPNLLQNFSLTQLSGENESDDHRDRVPKQLDSLNEISWTPVWSYTQNKQKWLPTSYCYQMPNPEDNKHCLFNPNGNATGNVLEEAILQGLLELVERDATAIWWYNKIQRPEINIESFQDEYLMNVKKHYSELGWDIWLLELTHDLNIPVVASVACERFSGSMIMGLGCHLDLHIAAQRAVTEMHQIFDPLDEQEEHWNKDDWGDNAFLFPKSDIASVQYNSATNSLNSSIKGVIDGIVQKLKEKQLETLILDYTRPGIKLKTVKVIVPGLRHFWKRLGDGRLYDVPVNLGWLERKHLEEELNPIALKL